MSSLLRPLSRLWLPPRLMRAPNGGILRAPEGGLAKDETCCCGDPSRGCSYYYGNDSAENVHPHAPSVTVLLTSPIAAPTFEGSAVTPDCCEALPQGFSLPIRDYTDPSPAFEKFGICPGQWIPNCYPYDGPCSGFDLDGETNFDVRAACFGAPDPVGDITPCIGPCAPEAGSPVWWVVFTGRGEYGESPAGVCDGEQNNVVVHYQVDAPTGSVTDYSGTWNLTKRAACTSGIGGFNQFIYCDFPDSVTLIADSA